MNSIIEINLLSHVNNFSSMLAHSK